ncbi:MAG: SUF system NifU family Fe-S cluster assembly protein [Candidatus Thermoplasmatota archaeon]|nr:SUF system NifU family Fe-S cluster assembly protein [Candidatus Thermoplasmatota archaeon]
MSYEMYQEAILDHYRNPRNFGELKDADISAQGDNPLCGDEIALYLKLNSDGEVEDVKFKGRGCAISLASASMLTVALKGKTLEEVEKIDKERILKILGILISPVRLKCAILPLEVLKVGLTASKHGDK